MAYAYDFLDILLLFSENGTFYLLSCLFQVLAQNISCTA